MARRSIKSVQVCLRIPEAFMKRFDEIAEMLGYTRNEAIREAMRRFVEESSQKLSSSESTVPLFKQLESLIAKTKELVQSTKT